MLRQFQPSSACIKASPPNRARYSIKILSHHVTGRSLCSWLLMFFQIWHLTLTNARHSAAYGGQRPPQKWVLGTEFSAVNLLDLYELIIVLICWFHSLIGSFQGSRVCRLKRSKGSQEIQISRLKFGFKQRGCFSRSWRRLMPTVRAPSKSGSSNNKSDLSVCSVHWEAMASWTSLSFCYLACRGWPGGGISKWWRDVKKDYNSYSHRIWVFWRILWISHQGAVLDVNLHKLPDNHMFSYIP